MADSNDNIFTRPDTFFGICEAIGQDFGFNPLWLRLAFVPALFFFPFQAPLAYLGLGLIVLASRKLFPVRGPAAAVVAAPIAAPAPAAIEPVRDARAEPVLLAA
jgi:phage shock protein PspC (stress-responsive transcriptional regulator)